MVFSMAYDVVNWRGANRDVKFLRDRHGSAFRVALPREETDSQFFNEFQFHQCLLF